MRSKVFAVVIVLMLLLGTIPYLIPVNAQQTTQEKPRGRYVYDNSKIIPENTTMFLEKLLLDLDKNTTAEIVIYTVLKMSGHGIKDENGNEITSRDPLTNTIFNKVPLPNGDGVLITGIGKKDKNNGVLIFVSGTFETPQGPDRQAKIEVGVGLQGVLPGGLAGEILEKEFAPNAQKGDFSAAFINTTKAVMERIPPAGYFPPPIPEPPPDLTLPVLVFILSVCVALFIIGSVGLTKNAGEWNRKRVKRNELRKTVETRLSELEQKVNAYSEKIPTFDDDIQHLPDWARQIVSREMGKAQLNLGTIRRKIAEARKISKVQPEHAYEILGEIKEIGAGIERSIQVVFVDTTKLIKSYKEEAPKKRDLLKKMLGAEEKFLAEMKQRGFDVEAGEKRLQEVRKALGYVEQDLKTTQLDFKTICDRCDEQIEKVQDIHSRYNSTLQIYEVNESSRAGMREKVEKIGATIPAAKADLQRLQKEAPREVWAQIEYSLQKVPSLLGFAKESLDRADKQNSLKAQEFNKATDSINQARTMLEKSLLYVNSPSEKRRELSESKPQAMRKLKDARELVQEAEEEAEHGDVHEKSREFARSARAKLNNVERIMESEDLINWIAVLLLLDAVMSTAQSAIDKAEEDVKKAKERRESYRRKDEDDHHWSSSSSSGSWGGGGGGGGGGDFGGGGGISVGGGAGIGW